MNRIFAAALFTISVAITPHLRAAHLRTGLEFALGENAPAGTNFWCVFPDIPSQWIVALYEKQPDIHSWPGHRYFYVPLVTVTKPATASGQALCQMMTVPAHTGPECVLVAFRNGVQQPYRGWNAFNPFGWHTFGVAPPVQAYVVEMPRGTPARDIRSYEQTMRRQWSIPM